MYIFVYIWPKSAHELLYRLHVCASQCVCLCWTPDQWSEKQKAHPAIWLQS